MSNEIIDTETILSKNEEWTRLDQDWGTPIDLDTDEGLQNSNLKPVLSSLDLRKSTFNSSFLFKKVRRKVSRQLSKKSAGSTSILDYTKFLQDLNKNELKESPSKLFYYIGGEILSAVSVEDICEEIDDIFKSVEKLCCTSVEKLCCATSTVRQKNAPKIPEFIQSSISVSDLSFDDTDEDLGREKTDNDDVDRFIDEVFGYLNYTIANVSILEEISEETGKDTVTGLVKKFTSVLNTPLVKCSPRKRKECTRFKDLAELWNSPAISSGE